MGVSVHYLYFYPLFFSVTLKSFENSVREKTVLESLQEVFCSSSVWRFQTKQAQICQHQCSKNREYLNTAGLGKKTLYKVQVYPFYWTDQSLYRLLLTKIFVLGCIFAEF